MSRIDPIDYETAPADVKAAYDAEVKRSGHVTNMKTTMLRSLTAYNTLMPWYTSWARLKEVVGTRPAVVFAHVISNGNDCLLCTTFFRRALIDAGFSPETFEPTADETLLGDLAVALDARPPAMDDALWARLRARWSDPEIVDIIAFGSLMVAYNVFNSAIEIDLDPELLRYQAAARDAA
jgi:hypothetical protein